MRKTRFHRCWQALTVILLFAGCARQQTNPPGWYVTETYDQALYRTEGVTCVALTGHADGGEPDCQKIVEAWQRGRARVAAIWPAAANIKMSQATFFRPKLYRVPEKPYPLIADGIDPLTGEVTEYVRGLTYEASPGGPMIVYSYPEVIEHESTHTIVYLLVGYKPRDAAAVSDQTLGYTHQSWPYFFDITCHGTIDDPFGEPGSAVSCSLPYTGD